VFTERQRFAPFGLQLGQPAATGSYTIHRGELSLPIPTKTSGLWLQGGDRIVIETAGGGGFGDPFEREPELVAADVEDGLVSREGAAREYGVIIDQDGRLDLQASQRARQNDQRPILRLRLTSVVDDDSSTIVVGAEVASAGGLASGAVVCCFNGRRSVYARVAATDGQEVSVSRVVASALDLAVGDEVSVRPLQRLWDVASTIQIRRIFSMQARAPVVARDSEAA
jgi:hypothetical protein